MTAATADGDFVFLRRCDGIKPDALPLRVWTKCSIVLEPCVAAG
jgi:hypothetical protein